MAGASTVPAISVSASSEPLLQLHSQGQAVVLLQQKLGGLAVDGKFGPLTQARVEAYQAAHHLTVDGVVGPQTWGSLLNNAPSAPPTSGHPNLSAGAKGPDVAQLQSYLGSLKVDGDFGPLTQARVKAFQASVGLPATGTADARTWTAAIAKGPGASIDGLGIAPQSIASAKNSGWAVDASKTTKMLYFLRYDAARQ
jgi:peptidoglycan hydrolase-like protein with peptidoglycan-binding domain